MFKELYFRRVNDTYVSHLNRPVTYLLELAICALFIAKKFLGFDAQISWGMVLLPFTASCLSVAWTSVTAVVLSALETWWEK